MPLVPLLGYHRNAQGSHPLVRTRVFWSDESPSTPHPDKSVGRSEAMRRSMLAMIESGNLKEAHPAYWAPFVVVGEGAAR